MKMIKTIQTIKTIYLKIIKMIKMTMASIVNGDLFIDRNFSIYAHTIFYEMMSIIN